MRLETILGELERTGARFAIAGAQVKLRVPRQRMPSREILSLLHEHKAEIIAYLQSGDTPEEGGASNSVPPSTIEEPARDDPYGERVQAALRRLYQPSYRPGMISWLAEADPALYQELTEQLPDEIHRLSSSAAPEAQFESAITAWLTAHRGACSLYRNAAAPLRRAKDAEMSFENSEILYTN